MATVNEAIEAIQDMNNDQLERVIEQVKFQRTYLARNATRTMRVGDAVQFEGRRGIIVKGKITKMNIKTCKVDAGHQGVWKVTASMLKAFCKIRFARSTL